jgi:hypothetical protein
MQRFVSAQKITGGKTAFRTQVLYVEGSDTAVRSLVGELMALRPQMCCAEQRFSLPAAAEEGPEGAIKKRSSQET